MVEVGFNTEWLNGEGIRGAELSATLASLRVDVHGQLVTRVSDQRARTVRDFVDVPLYPLAEWLAANWWFLVYEFENAAKNGDPDFNRRHSLGKNTEGYAYPDLVVKRWGSRTSISWGSAPSPWTKVEFLDRGQAFVDREEFRQVCADLIDRVIRRLAGFRYSRHVPSGRMASNPGCRRSGVEFLRNCCWIGMGPVRFGRVKARSNFPVGRRVGVARQ